MPNPTVPPLSRDRAAELAHYREGVQTLFDICSNKVISNGEPAHAAILFEKFFEHAKKHVRIFCRNLRADVFENPAVVREAARALKRNVKFSILLQEPPQPSAFCELVAASLPDVCISIADDEAKKQPFNFTVMDEQAVRYEPNHDHGIVAQASMCNPEIAKRLVRAFDRLFLLGAPFKVEAEEPVPAV